MKNLNILTFILSVNNNIFSCCGPKPLNEDNLIDVNEKNIIEILRKVCQVHENVKNETLKKEYDYILDQIIDNGKNKKPEKKKNEDKNERFVIYLYKLAIFFFFFNDNKKIIPVKCAELPYNYHEKSFWSQDYVLFHLNYVPRNLLNNGQDNFKDNVEKEINENFKDQEFIKIEEIAKVFNEKKPDYFYITVAECDCSDKHENTIRYGFVFERNIRHQDVFSNKVSFEERKKGCC